MCTHTHSQAIRYGFQLMKLIYLPSGHKETFKIHLWSRKCKKSARFCAGCYSRLLRWQCNGQCLEPRAVIQLCMKTFFTTFMEACRSMCLKSDTDFGSNTGKFWLKSHFLPTNSIAVFKLTDAIQTAIILKEIT